MDKAVEVDLDVMGRATAAEQWLRKVRSVTNKKQADEGALHITNIGHAISALRQAERNDKLPYQNKISEIVERYRRSITPLTELRDIIRLRLQPFLEKLEMTTNAPTTRIGTVGHAVVLRSFWQAEIIDPAKALRAAANEPEILAALQMVANRFARESKGLKPLAGTRATELRKGV
jgi:hypothetical protein